MYAIQSLHLLYRMVPHKCWLYLRTVPNICQQKHSLSVPDTNLPLFSDRPVWWNKINVFCDKRSQCRHKFQSAEQIIYSEIFQYFWLKLLRYITCNILSQVVLYFRTEYLLYSGFILHWLLDYLFASKQTWSIYRP